MVEENEKGESRGFKVEDRRRFSPETGVAREAVEETEASAGIGEKGPQQQPRGETQASAKESQAEIDFSTFIISLSTQALMHLGEISNPLSGKVETDVSVAKQMIDILGMLRDKTRGNLTPGEEQLVEDVLFDLRMKYVEAVKKK